MLGNVTGDLKPRTLLQSEIKGDHINVMLSENTDGLGGATSLVNGRIRDLQLERSGNPSANQWVVINNKNVHKVS